MMDKKKKILFLAVSILMPLILLGVAYKFGN